MPLRSRVIAIALAAVPLCQSAAAELGPVVFSQPRDFYGGPASDTSFLSYLGQPAWQVSADDFRFDSEQLVCGIRWWGFYGLSGVSQTPDQLSPPTSEAMQVVFYSDVDGVPGPIVYETTYYNVVPVPTGIRFEVPQRDEFKWELALGACFDAMPNSTYWLSVAQLGDPDSLFRWDSTYQFPGHVFRNQAVGETWTLAALTGMAFELTAIPEPATGALMLGALLATRLRRPRQRTVQHSGDRR